MNVLIHNVAVIHPLLCVAPYYRGLFECSRMQFEAAVIAAVFLSIVMAPTKLRGRWHKTVRLCAHRVCAKSLLQPRNVSSLASLSLSSDASPCFIYKVTTSGQCCCRRLVQYIDNDHEHSPSEERHKLYSTKPDLSSLPALFSPICTASHHEQLFSSDPFGTCQRRKRPRHDA